MIGIGGTGVVTVAPDPRHRGDARRHAVRGLDQTGLAQKGGAVVSDIKIVDGRRRPARTRSAAGECDLYLGCDLLGRRRRREPGGGRARTRTVAVVSTAEVPTGPMVTDPATPFPERRG